MIIENHEREVLKTSQNLVKSSINQSSLMKNQKAWEKTHTIIIVEIKVSHKKKSKQPFLL